MYRVILIDDEPIILEGLHKIVKWNELGFEIIGSASNGKQGLELALLHEPDLIITDVRMKFVDGISLIRTLKQKNKDTLCVVISAYDEFEYARDACNLGAFAYLLKPLVREELLQVVYNARKRLDARQGDQGEANPSRGETQGEQWGKLIKDAVVLMDEAVSNADLTVKMAAERLHVNPIYFGQRFKKETGKSFNEYLNELRIRKAKSLLDFGHTKVYEIAERTGYKNAYYFNVVFKRLTGMTPLQYRNQREKR